MTPQHSKHTFKLESDKSISSIKYIKSRINNESEFKNKPMSQKSSLSKRNEDIIKKIKVKTKTPI